MTTRDVRGRFVSTANAPESGEGKFKTYAEMPVEIQGSETGQLAYDTVARYAPAGDELAQGGSRSPLRSKRPELVHPDDEGFHNGVLRTAARRSAGRWDDPSGYLVGLSEPGTPATGVRTVDDGD